MLWNWYSGDIYENDQYTTQCREKESGFHYLWYQAVFKPQLFNRCWVATKLKLYLPQSHPAHITSPFSLEWQQIHSFHVKMLSISSACKTHYAPFVVRISPLVFIHYWMWYAVHCKVIHLSVCLFVCFSIHATSAQVILFIPYYSHF